MVSEEEATPDGPLRLKGAQREIRDEYFACDAGLFTLSCVPGSGKSATATHIAAEDLLRRYVDGDPTPELHVAVVSFNRDEAASIVPAVCERLRVIVEHELVPAASEVSEPELKYLLQRVRRAPFIGTIDSLLRGVLREVVHDVGFETMPSVGNEALLKRVHAECYDRISDDPACARRLERLEAAYPSGDHDAGVAEMLERALRYCRDRRLTTEAFRVELERTRDAVYGDGEPDSFEDVVSSVERCLGDYEAAGERARDSVSDVDRGRIVEADNALYHAWGARIEDLCETLSTYRETYRDAVREFGVLSHIDVSYLVDAYFGGEFEDFDRELRDHVLGKYRSRIRSLIVDEAQDVSAIQHAALSHLVTPEVRVLGCGDVLQGIYLWRHADPSLFESATTSGRYLGIDWDVHENRTAATTYRCVPAIASAVNTVAEPIFGDPARGNIGDLDAEYTPLEAARDEVEETAVHVSSFTGVGHPGTSTWANPDGGRGEANILATHISRGISDGTFADENGDPLGITVLFRRKSRMSDYDAAFEAEGLRVRNASENLFDCPAVRAVFDVCDWLVDSASPEGTRRLVTESGLGLESLEGIFEANAWSVDRVLDSADEGALTEAQRETLAALRRLRDRRDVFETFPARTYVEEVVGALALRADPHGDFGDVDPAQRVANADALVETIAQWAGDEHHSLPDLLDLVEPFREEPDAGPTRPSSVDADYDVLFQTVHRAKGDQDDVVVIADPGFNIWTQGPHAQRFVAQGNIAGLAPPTDASAPTDVTIPPFDGGLYDPSDGWQRDVGLRWATARWRDTAVPTADPDVLVGPPRLRRLAENERAESWRLLYVALMRAMDHLMIPLPRTFPGGRPRDRWLDSIRDGLRFPDGCTETYTLAPIESDPNSERIRIGVNDADLLARRHRKGSSTPLPEVAVRAPISDRLAPWVPRFVNPSTMYPLTKDKDRYALAHLLGEPLHTETNDVAEDLPLVFERMGPDEVGSCVHGVLTELVKREVSERAVRSMGDEVRDVFDEVVHEREPGIGVDERDGLFAFFSDVLDDFLESDLWARIAEAETVVVERPVDGLVSLGDVEIEVHGEADFLTVSPSGEIHVTDVKASLTDLTEETRRRYELQVAAYGYLFDRQEASAEPVRRTVETFGATRETVSSSWSPSIVERRLSMLTDD